MGEYADMAIDDMLAMDEYELRYPEEFEHELPDEWGTFRRFRSGPRPKTCKYCGEFPLFWEKTEEGWRLADIDIETDEMIIHTCKMRFK
jgi:hypothetical protein